MDLLLRPGVAADLPGIAEVYLAARGAAEASGAMPPGIHPPTEVHAYVAGWDLAATDVWVAVERRDVGPEAIVGFAHATATWLESLYVVPSAQASGVGTALLELVKATHPDGFALWVFVTNEPARRFYERHGFTEILRTDGADNEERAPDIQLAWVP